MTVYDLIPLLYPDWFETGNGNFIVPKFRQILASLRPTDYVHCISECTRNDLLNAMPALDPQRVFVSALAADPEVFHAGVTPEAIASTRLKYAIPEGKYLLSVCTLEPRKNVESVVKAFGRVVSQQKINDLSLVLVGTKGWNSATIDQVLADAHEHRSRVLITGFVPDADLAPLYTGATAFIYPSRYEGFGLPPLEAMTCGTPVITSNNSSLPEVVGDAGIMVDPMDLDGLCQAIFSLIGNITLRNEMSDRALKRSASFSWNQCVGKILAEYQRAI